MAGASIDIVGVDALHARLGYDRPIDYPPASRTKRFADWKMEVDDAPIFRYLYGQARPRRHLEFGTWEGEGACYCLEECDARVWTLNLPDGERDQSGNRLYETDGGSFIGRRYRSAGFGGRVTQILCDSREWNEAEYAADFFDTALIDGGHTADVVLSDTRKALSVTRSGGLILWHDFCPDPSVFTAMPAVRGVIGGLTSEWSSIRAELSDVFWVQPSFLLVGVRR